MGSADANPCTAVLEKKPGKFHLNNPNGTGPFMEIKLLNETESGAGQPVCPIPFHKC